MFSIGESNGESDVGVSFAIHMEAVIGAPPFVGQVRCPDFLAVIRKQNQNGVVPQPARLQLVDHLTHQVVGHSNARVVDFEVLLRDPFGALAFGVVHLIDHQ